MDLYQKLIVLSCVTSTLTMLLVAVAVVPHLKQGMALVRDAILWVTFILVVAAVGWLGWQRVSSRLSGSQPQGVGTQRPTETRSTALTHGPTPKPTLREQMQD